MLSFIQNKLLLKIVTFVAMLSIVMPLFMAPDVAFAKGGNKNRERYYGIIQSKPAALQGTWVIGGRTITTVRGTEFDQLQGPLKVGACAKVDICNGQVHEIDSEPMRNCR